MSLIPLNGMPGNSDVKITPQQLIWSDSKHQTCPSKAQQQAGDVSQFIIDPQMHLHRQPGKHPTTTENRGLCKNFNEQMFKTLATTRHQNTAKPLTLSHFFGEEESRARTMAPETTQHEHELNPIESLASSFNGCMDCLSLNLHMYQFFISNLLSRI